MPQSPSTGRRLVALIGALAGVFLYLDVRALGVEMPAGTGAGAAAVAAAALSAAIGGALLSILRSRVRLLVLRFVTDRPGVAAAYLARDGWGYTTFLLLGAGAFGVRLSIPFVYVIVGAFAMAQVLLALTALTTEKGAERASFFDSNAWLAVLFLLSGMAALVYEVVWQRVLFSVYGVNIESVTMIVALFMFGLGIGALVGGALSRRYPKSVPSLFAACELGIGAFGIVSIPLIEWVAARTLHLPLAAVAATILALLLVPVVLMGATLPLLVHHLTLRDPNIGSALGRLYSLNTLGAALASLFTVDVLFVLLGRQATIFAAVTLNAVVAVLVFRFATRLRRRGAETVASPAPARQEEQVSALSARLPRWAVLTIAFLAGFISLSQEIVWMRPVSYATQGAPQVFGQVLGVFLVGVAAGAWKAKKLCEAGLRDPIRRLGSNLVLAGAVYYLAMPLFGRAMVVSRGIGVPIAYLVAGLVAYLMGLTLPLIAHLDANAKKSAGGGVAAVYAANVAGATAGPLITGFVLLDRFTFAECALIVTVLTVSAGLVLLRVSFSTGKHPRRSAALACAASAAALLLYAPLYHHLPERLRDGPSYVAANGFVRVVQNRSGVLAVRHDPNGDVMYGGGIYDGSFNLGIAKNTNDISRAFMMATLHRKPQRVLQIGLSTGSWTWILAAHDAIERITVVEINPGYEELIRGYPMQREILTNPKVDIHYDDGRRWLMRNPDARFDFVMMNATYHWRSNMTNLLSREFMELCKSHLAPGGVLYFNNTHSTDATRTAAEVFQYVTSYRTFVAASDQPFDMSLEEKRANLRGFRRDGKSLYEEEGAEALASLEYLARSDTSDQAPRHRATPSLQIITDDNMLTEFKSIQADSAIGALYRWYDPQQTWQ